MKKALIVISILMIVSLLAACGGPTGGLKITKSEAEKIGLTYQPRAEGEPQYGGEIVRLLPAMPGGFDLHRKPRWAGMYCIPVFNNLIKSSLDYYNTVPETLIADLAEDWEISDDGLNYTFYLREGVQWHDGTSFTADDVVYSLDKMNDPDRSRIVGEFPAYNRAEKIDDYTVKIYLKQPSATFLLNLAGPYAIIEAEHMANVDPNSTDYLMGTGPFMFKRWVREEVYELTRNPNYFMEDEDGNQLPYISSFKLIYGTAAAAVDALITNRVDMATAISTQQDMDRVTFASPDIVMFETPVPRPHLIALNTKNAPLDDARVRRAIALVVDPKDIIIARFGSENFSSIGGLVNPAWGLSQDEIDEIIGFDQSMDDRIAEAEQLMKDAGYTGGAKLRLIATSPPTQAVMTLISDNLRRYLDIECEIIMMQAAATQELQTTGEWEMHIISVAGFMGDPSGVLNYFIGGDPANWTGYSNSRVDQLIEDIDAETDPAKRRDMVQEVERILLTDLPTLTGMFPTTFQAHYPYVINFRFTGNPYGPQQKFEDVWLEE